jgi:hypothetical protein
MLSYSRGPGVPVRSETIYQAFAAACLRFPERIALISRPDGVRWVPRTYLAWLPSSDSLLEPDTHVFVKPTVTRLAAREYVSIFSTAPDRHGNALQSSRVSR